MFRLILDRAHHSRPLSPGDQGRSAKTLTPSKDREKVSLTRLDTVGDGAGDEFGRSALVVGPVLLQQGLVVLDSPKGEIAEKQAGQRDAQDEEQEAPAPRALEAAT